VDAEGQATDLDAKLQAEQDARKSQVTCANARSVCWYKELQMHRVPLGTDAGSPDAS
jgi:hypothetical protein